MSYFSDIRDSISSNPKKFLIGLLLSLFALWFVFGDFGLLTRLSMELEHRQLEERLAEEQQKIAEQKAMIDHAGSPDSVEKVARERYNFHKEDETVFIIKDE